MIILGQQISEAIFWGGLSILVSIIAILITLFAWIFPRRARLRKQEEERIQRIEEQVGDMKAYFDGLPKAKDPIRIPFDQGLTAMNNDNWDEAIGYFNKASEKASGKQLVALFNLIGLCNYDLSKPDDALNSFEESIRLAEQFNDKEGKAKALGNIGICYWVKGDLDKALKYHEDGLKLDKEIGSKKGEAIALANIGLIYTKKGNKEKALNYFNRSFTLFKQIGAKEEIEKVEDNIRRIKEQK